MIPAISSIPSENAHTLSKAAAKIRSWAPPLPLHFLARLRPRPGHCLLGIESYNDLLGHPVLGISYESFVMASILERFTRFEPFFYRSSGGGEVDLVVRRGQRMIAIEVKSAAAPVGSRGFHEALEVIEPDQALVVAPVESPFPLTVFGYMT